MLTYLLTYLLSYLLNYLLIYVLHAAESLLAFRKYGNRFTGNKIFQRCVTSCG